MGDQSPSVPPLEGEVLPSPRPFQALQRFDPQNPAERPAPAAGVQRVGGVDVDPGTPLAYLMDLMQRPADPDMSPEQRLYHERMRLEAAKAALPAIHPRLAQVEHGGRVSVSHEEALAQLERGESE